MNGARMMANDTTKLANLLSGYRTYIVAAAILTCGILKHYGIAVPEVAWATMGALGLGFIRAGVAASK